MAPHSQQQQLQLARDRSPPARRRSDDTDGSLERDGAQRVEAPRRRAVGKRRSNSPGKRRAAGPSRMRSGKSSRKSGQRAKHVQPTACSAAEEDDDDPVQEEVPDPTEPDENDDAGSNAEPEADPSDPPPPGATAAVPAGVTLASLAAAADSYENMDETEKTCFEAYVKSNMDNSLEPGTDEWTTAFAASTSSLVETWQAMTEDERLGFCHSGLAATGCRSRSRKRKDGDGGEAGGAGGEKKVRRKKGWTCYTVFMKETLDEMKKAEPEPLKLNPGNFAQVMRDIASKWYALTDEQWASYKCKHKRRKPKPPCEE